MEKVYMPDMDTLYQMQDMGANVYRYLVIKKIESIICDWVGTLRGILNRHTLDEIAGIKEYKDIVKAICLLYPGELENLELFLANGLNKELKLDLFREDAEFCMQLLDNSPSIMQSNLDYLVYFSSGVTSNELILKKVLVQLKKELAKNPKYRFEYLSDSNNNTLLDDIFGGRIGNNELKLLRGKSKDEAVNALVMIEPAYTVNLPSSYLCDYLGFNDENQMRMMLLNDGMNALANRYKIDRNIGTEYLGKDILTNPDSEVKKLIKNIDKTMMRK